MSLVPSDSRYVPLTQQRWCCVPTCIQMIMYKHGIPLAPAELIGYYLGLTIPKEELKYFWKGRTGKKPRAGWGTQIYKKEYSPNVAFEKLGIPLRMSLRLINEFPDLQTFSAYLKSVDKSNRDVLVCYDWGTLFNDGHHGGHVCVLDKVYLRRGEMRIIDPEYKAPKWRVIKIKDMFEAMKYHGEKKSGGFWELTKK